MDVSNDYKLTWINRAKNKDGWRVRSFKKDIETEISQYRIYAVTHKGTFVSYWCNREANYLDRELMLALKGLRS